MGRLEAQVAQLQADVADMRRDIRLLLEERSSRVGSLKTVKLFWGLAVGLPGWVVAVLNWLNHRAS